MKKAKVYINGKLEYMVLASHDSQGYHYYIAGTTSLFTFPYDLRNMTKGFEIENSGYVFTIL